MHVRSLTNSEQTLETIVSDAISGKFVIPKFQRDFVWNRTQVSALGDSLLRGYPISSLLIMPSNGSLKIPHTQLAATGAKVDEAETYYMLDGQQRVTSLFKIFANLDDKEEYYYDILSILADRFPEDDLERMVPEKGNNRTAIDTDCLCRHYTPSQTKDRQATRQNYRLISCSAVLNSNYSGYINKYMSALQQSGASDEQINEYVNYLNGLFGVLRAYNIPVVKISEHCNLDLVCRVFEKVNSSGTKLTPFDLINAKSYGAALSNEEGISGYISNRILNHPIYQVPDVQRALNSYFEFDKASNKFKVFPILKILHLSRIMKTGQTKYLIISNASMLAREADEWFNSWNFYEDRLMKFFEWSLNWGLMQSFARTFFEYSAAMAIALPEMFEENLFQKMIIKHGYHISIIKRTIGNRDAPIFTEFLEYGKQLLRSGSSYKLNVVAPQPPSVVDKDHILKAKKDGQAFHSIMSIMYKYRYKSLFSEDLFGDPIIFDASSKNCDVHHLVAKANTKGKSDVFDSVANLVLLGQDSNRHILRDKNLDEMRETVQRFCSDSPGKYNRLMAANLIPLNTNDEDEFINQRADIITEYVNGFLYDR